MIHRLLGGTDSELWSIPADEQVIVVAHELSPGLTVQLDREHVVGLVSEEGTRTSHAAILAHSLGIPAVMGAAGVLAGIPNGTMLLLDGQSGTIVLDPNRDELEEAKVQVSRRHKLELQLEAVVGEPAVTPSGRAIILMGNVDLRRRSRPRTATAPRASGSCAPSFCSPAGPACPPKTSRPTTSGGWRAPSPT